jgi:quercetin dioxygenase-like cupin family protein
MEQPIVVDLGAAAEHANDAIVSRPLVENEHHKVVLFSFAAGQELSEHTASVPAVIQILAGQAGVRLGDQDHEAGPGAFFYMPANLRHAVQAKTDMTMLLTMFRT